MRRIILIICFTLFTGYGIYNLTGCLLSEGDGIKDKLLERGIIGIIGGVVSFSGLREK